MSFPLSLPRIPTTKQLEQRQCQANAESIDGRELGNQLFKPRIQKKPLVPEVTEHKKKLPKLEELGDKV